MKIYKFLPAFLLLIVGQAGAQQPSEIFQGLNQIVGSWQMQKGDFHIKEEWKQINDTLYEGFTALKKKGEWRKLEEVQLLLSRDTIWYIPAVTLQNNGKPIPFALISKEQNRYVFENKLHDFPQQIIYHFADENTLNASINGRTEKEGFRTVDFPYKRMDE